MNDDAMFWTLDAEGNPESVPMEEWSKRGLGQHNIVAKTLLGQWEVSTVFLGINHQFGAGPPILWEMMIFGPEPWDGWQRRYHSRADAETGHAEAVAMIGTPKRTPRRKVVPAE